MSLSSADIHLEMSLFTDCSHLHDKTMTKEIEMRRLRGKVLFKVIYITQIVSNEAEYICVNFPL